MRLFKLQDWPLPLTILAFVGLAVTFLRPIFNTTTRWAILGVLIVFLLTKGCLWFPLRTRFGRMTLAFALWVMTTVMWSEVPLLSGMKGLAFVVIAFPCMAAGLWWVRQHEAKDALDYLFPLTIVALLAGVLGRYAATAVVDTGGGMLYQGLVSGSNMFGSMLAMCSPFLLWKIYSRWSNVRWRIFWLILGAIGIYYLLAAGSRGAILVVLFTILGLFLTLGVSRRLYFITILFGAATVGFVLYPGGSEQLKQRFLYKHAPTGEGVLYTRREVWQISYDQAKKGGWLGGGYGVTIGDTEFEGGFTAVGYGREKGNSQLAIIEETGLIGFALYLNSLLPLFSSLLKSQKRWRRRPEKVLRGIVTGTLFGMLISSVFEAWWVAPSSPESVYFWTLAGVALGLASIRPGPRRRSQAFEAERQQSARARRSVPARISV